MSEKRGSSRAWDFGDEEESSGVRVSPWSLQEQLSVAGARVMARFHGLKREDRESVLESALDDLTRDPRSVEADLAWIEARASHAVLSAAVDRDLGRWAARIGAPAAEIERELARARERVASLSGRERSIFLAVSSLDDVALPSEVRRVVLCGAVAYQVRWNTAHQHLSRAWRKVCEGGPLAAWCRSFRVGHRFVCGPPPFELWEAARAYMDACCAQGAGLEAWAEADEAHMDWFNQYKQKGAQATLRWRELVESLDASGVRPGDVQKALIRCCTALGADRWVVPAKLDQQSWHDLLHAAPRPAAPARAAWRAFLREHGFGPAVHAAFHVLEQDAALVEVANVELENAYRRLLASADELPPDALRARDAFRRLVDAVTISDGALVVSDAEPSHAASSHAAPPPPPSAPRLQEGARTRRRGRATAESGEWATVRPIRANGSG